MVDLPFYGPIDRVSRFVTQARKFLIGSQKSASASTLSDNKNSNRKLVSRKASPMTYNNHEAISVESIEIDVVWGDMDANGHVNNVAYFRYFENARVALLRRVGWLEVVARGGVGFVVKSVQAEFRRALFYPDRVTVTARVTEISRDRLTLDHEVISRLQGATVATGRGIVVAFDYGQKAKALLPGEVVRRLAVAERG